MSFFLFFFFYKNYNVGSKEKENKIQLQENVKFVQPVVCSPFDCV